MHSDAAGDFGVGQVTAVHLIRTVTNGRATSIAGTVHYPNMERSDVFNEILGDFLHTV